MDDKQRQYLSSLGIGEAIVFTENTESPVHVKIGAKTDTNGLVVPNSVVRKNYLAQKDNKDLFGNTFRENAMRQAYNVFVWFAKLVRDSNGSGTLTELQCGRLKDSVEEVSNKFFAGDKNVVWKELIERFQKSAGNSKNTTQRENLIKYFAEKFYEEKAVSIAAMDGNVYSALAAVRK